MPSTITPDTCALRTDGAGRSTMWSYRRSFTGGTALRLLPLILALSVLVTEPLGAQNAPRSVPAPERAESSVAEVPFGPGEHAKYDVKLGPVTVGEAVMDLVGVTPVRGRPSYHASWVVQGGVPLARVNDHYETWFDIETLASRRFIQNIHQVRYRSQRHFEIYPAEQTWERVGTDAGGQTTTDHPMDEIALIYYARTLPLEVGETYTLQSYFREDRNPVVLEVLRREQVDVPAGTFETIVIRPIIKAGGLFGEGGEAQVYLTDDEHRVIVKLESRVPLVGSLSLHLKEHQEGVPLRRGR